MRYLSCLFVFHTADNVYIFRTPSTDERSYSYFWLVSEIEHITFQVQACAEASIVLSKTPEVTDSNAYEIIIGYYNNAKTIIRTEVGSESRVASADTVDVLSCDEARTFWISTLNGHVQVRFS